MLHKMLHHLVQRCIKHYVVNINLSHNDIIITSFYEEGTIGSPSRISLLDKVVKQSFVPGPRRLFERIEGLL